MNTIDNPSHVIRDVKLVGLRRTAESADLDCDLHLRVDAKSPDTAVVDLHLYTDRHSIHLTMEDCIGLTAIPDALYAFELIRFLLRDTANHSTIGDRLISLAALPDCALEIRALRDTCEVLFTLTIGPHFRTEATTDYGDVDDLFVFDRSASNAA